MLFIALLIILFLSLIIYQIFLASSKSKMIEGMESGEYKTYDTNNPNNTLILAQQNAGNIEFLKSRIDNLAAMKTRVDDLTEEVKAMNDQIQALVQQQADFAEQMVGTTPPVITGT